eukprot:TRINITY_DN8958_c0_g1_i4.p2 TRINITY_DN8958_c0_g1~~TRINITY_DN8958_c0_g1_i4.p2  ORF type:complete len:248 (-),score=64.81 TRINITY_DN8958_c0_g1_i4:132-806(-)
MPPLSRSSSANPDSPLASPSGSRSLTSFFPEAFRSQIFPASPDSMEEEAPLSARGAVPLSARSATGRAAAPKSLSGSASADALPDGAHSSAGGRRGPPPAAKRAAAKGRGGAERESAAAKKADAAAAEKEASAAGRRAAAVGSRPTGSSRLAQISPVAEAAIARAFAELQLLDEETQQGAELFKAEAAQVTRQFAAMRKMARGGGDSSMAVGRLQRPATRAARA